MRRIYESEALHRDDSEPFSPSERHTKHKSFWSIDWSFLGRLIPNVIRPSFLSVSVSTPKDEYACGEPIRFEFSIKNNLPVSLSITTRTPVVWSWDVDGISEASHVPLRDPPEERRTVVFERGSRKEFSRRWDQMFKVSDRQWEPAEPGTYTIGAGLNVDDARSNTLYDETTVTIG